MLILPQIDHRVERLFSKHLEHAKDIFRLHKRGMLIFSAHKGRELENNVFSLSLFFFGGGGRRIKQNKCKKDLKKRSCKKIQKNFKSKQVVTVWLKKDSHKSKTAAGGGSLGKIVDSFCQLFCVHFPASDLIQLCLERALDTQLSQPAYEQITL